MLLLPLQQLRFRFPHGPMHHCFGENHKGCVKLFQHLRSQLRFNLPHPFTLLIGRESFRLLHFRASPGSLAFRTSTVTSSSSNRSAATGALTSRCAVASAPSSTSTICSSSRLA